MKYIYLLFVILLPSLGVAQYSISARVLNQQDTKPLPDASVFISNSTIGTKTKVDGTFSLNNIKPGKYELVVSIVGFDTYTQSVIVTDKNINLSDIGIFAKTQMLGEVKIKPVDDPLWYRNYELFKTQFLGDKVLPEDCKIINPKILDLKYDEATDILHGSSGDFLLIENNALGYRLKYLLTDFTLNRHDLTKTSSSYSGHVLFEEMTGTPSQQRRWNEARHEVYQNSLMHFLRALIAGSSYDDGFKIEQLSVYANPNRPPDSLIKAKIAYYDQLKEKRPADHDSLSYWKRKLKLPATLQKFNPFPLPIEDIVQRTNQKGIYVLGCDNDELYVSFNAYHIFDKHTIRDVNDAFNKENTLISFNNIYVYFDSNGWLFDPSSVTFDGVWAKKRVACLLPEEYADVITKKNAADTSLTQISNKLDGFTKQSVNEKAYLHLNNTHFNSGDTIWYKAYVVSGEHHQLSDGSGILQVDLIDPTDSVITHQVLQLKAGVAWADIALPYKLKPENYRIRAYTNRMRNDGNEYFYDQVLQIGDQDTPQPKSNNATQANVDVQFFPESGYMVNGLRSKIAVKAVNSNGLGQDVSGTVEDDNGNVVAEFTTQHLGMGVFVLTPQAGKTYKAKIKGITETSTTVSLPAAKEKGYVFKLNNNYKDSVLLSVEVNKAFFKENKDRHFYLIGQSGGKIYYTASASLTGPVVQASVEKSRFPTGIIRFTLFSDRMEILNERTAFIMNDDLLKLNGSTASDTYTTRQKVKIDISLKNQVDATVGGNLSVAIVKKDNATDNVSANNILSYLLLTSDLKGFVEQPAYYFENPNEQTNADLDALMLTQGYQRFEWKKIIDGKPPENIHQSENGLSISGFVKTASGKPVPNRKINLVAFKNGFATDTTTDADGHFNFTNLNLPDSTKVTLDAKQAGGNNNIVIAIDKPLNPPVNKGKRPEFFTFLPVSQQTGSDSTHKRQAQAGDLQKDRKQLKEVVIKSHSVTKLHPTDLSTSANLNGPGNADQIISGDDLNQSVFLLQGLIGKLRGVSLMNGAPYSYRIIAKTKAGNPPQPMALIIDGAVQRAGSCEILGEINTSSIKSIEVLTSPQYTGIYGEDASGGALVITTKKGIELNASNKEPLPGTLNYIFNGFYKAKEFYSPKYDNPKINDRMSDLRSTVYWNPEIIPDKDGKASVEFFNSDTKGIYQVIIEGIDNAGRPGRNVFTYKVE